MKKMLLAVLFIAVLLCAGAQAEKPTGGMRPISLENAIRVTPGVPKGSKNGDSGPNIVGPTECETGIEYTWNYTGSSENFTLMMAVYDNTYGDPDTADIMYDPTENCSSLSYTFYYPGKYGVFVLDNDTDDYEYCDIYVSDGGDNVVRRMVREIKAENPKTGEYERAMWFYDWLLEHCEYDNSLQYFDAASLFLQGTGVCNSYVRALALLLEEDGIDFRRVAGIAHVGDDAGGHTWIAIKLDGVWCLCDPTWDDNYFDASGVRYNYFGMTEALCAIEHETQNYVNGAVTCDSLANSYYVRDERWQEFASGILSTYQSQRDSGRHCFLMPGLDKVEDEYLRAMQGEVAAWGLNHTDWEDDKGRTFRPEFVYDWDAVMLVGRDPSGGTLKLPQSLKVVEAESLAATAANHVVVPSGCTAIEGGAFAGMDLWEIVVPDSVTSIDEDAFKGCGSVFIVASADSAAAEFAKGHDIPTWPDLFS